MKNTQVFARKSSGLIRVMSPYSAFAYNVLNIGVIFPWVYLLTLGLWPDANVPLGILITGIFTSFLAVAYAGLAAAMPRTGGDYVFQSRTLKPFLGFAIVATMIVTFFLQWQALGGWLTAILGFAPLFTGLGLTMNSASLLSLGVWFTTPIGIWVTTAAASTFAAVILIKSFRWFVMAQWVMWYGFLLSFVIMIAFFALTPTSVFITRFNSAMAILSPGTPDYYHYVLTAATQNGFTPVSGFSWASTLFVLPVALTSLGWVGYAQEQAGEIQGASSLKNQLFINVGGGLFSTALMMILAYTFINTVGQGWLAAAAYGNFLTGTVNMPIPPWFSNLAAVLTDNPLLVFLMIIGILLNAVQVVFNVIIGWTRVAVAMSIDGALPKFVSRVNDRTHTPVVAHVIFLILGGFVMSYVYNFVPGYITLTLAVTAVATVFYIGTAFGGAIFPWSRKEVYESSPIAKYKVGKIPVITICGLIATLFSLWMLYNYLTIPGLGVASLTSEVIMLAIFLGWTGFFFLRRWWLKRVGINLDLAYKEVPPI
jgi:basic amino acid/polyamine antiporter, APA family